MIEEYYRKHREWGAFIKGIIQEGDLIRAGRELAAMATEALNGPGSASIGFRHDTLETLGIFHAACMAQEQANNAAAVLNPPDGIKIVTMPLISMLADARRLSPYIVRHAADQFSRYAGAEIRSGIDIQRGATTSIWLIHVEMTIGKHRPAYEQYKYIQNHNAEALIDGIDAAEATAREWWARMSKEWNS